MGVHELGANRAQHFSGSVLNQAQLSRIEYHAHLPQSKIIHCIKNTEKNIKQTIEANKVVNYKD
jgi:hypothetical protein